MHFYRYKASRFPFSRADHKANSIENVPIKNAKNRFYRYAQT